MCHRGKWHWSAWRFKPHVEAPLHLPHSPFNHLLVKPTLTAATAFPPKGDRSSESTSGLSKYKIIFLQRRSDKGRIVNHCPTYRKMVLSPTPLCKAVERDDLAWYLESHSTWWHHEYRLSAAACCNMLCSRGPVPLHYVNNLLEIQSLEFLFRVHSVFNMHTSIKLAFSGQKHNKSTVCLVLTYTVWLALAWVQATTEKFNSGFLFFLSFFLMMMIYKSFCHGEV